MAARPDVAGEQASEGSEEEEEEEGDVSGCSEYDSTWEEEEEGEEEDGEPLEDKQGRKGLGATPSAGAAKEKPKPPEKPVWWPPSATWASGRQDRRKPNLSSVGFRRCKSTSRRNWGAAQDMQKYRWRYPDLEETEVGEEDMWNLSFYKNEIHFKPHGLHIEELLEKWQNDYATLEENHSYIQWLFPLREPGMNWRAKILTCQEIEAFKKSKEVLGRFVRAYKLMLGFYGINLINEETGELKRAENWYERFENLNQYSHNNLRITRILKCLGEMGYEHYQVHLVKFFLTETLVHQQLPRVLRSALDYFMFTVRSKQKRRELVHFAWQHFKPKREFVWGPHKKLRRFKPRSPEFLSHQEPKEEQEATSQGTSPDLLKEDAEPPNEISPRLKEEPSNGGDVGDAGKNVLNPLNDQAADRTRSDSPIGQPVSQAGTESSCPPNDSATCKSGEKEPASPLEGNASQGDDSGESQARRVVEHPVALEENDISTLASPAETKQEKHGSKENPPAAPLGEENGNSSEGESLKEAKKRKLEVSRLSGKRAEALKGPPTDIEKISFNLEEVVIDPKDVGEALPVEVQAKPLAPERASSGDDRDVKEVESVVAVIKRRKVEEMAPKEEVAETAVRGDTEVIPLEGQPTRCSASRFERTEKVGQDDKAVADRCTDTLTSEELLVNSQTHRAESGLPLKDSQPDKMDEPETTSVIDNKEPQPLGTQPAVEKETGQLSGQEEKVVDGEKETAAERTTIVKAEKSKLTTGGPGEEEEVSQIGVIGAKGQVTGQNFS